MRFHNATKHEQKFTIGKHDYVVRPGHNVDIDDRLAYVVKARGMVLTEGPATDPDAPVARPVEALPGRVNVLLASPRISPESAEHWRRLYARASTGDRARLIAELEAVAEGRGALDRSERDEDADASDAPASNAEDDVDAQVGAAAAAVGKGRRKG